MRQRTIVGFESLPMHEVTFTNLVFLVGRIGLLTREANGDQETFLPLLIELTKVKAGSVGRIGLVRIELVHGNISRPFDKPKSGRIAVKVINHLGDEVMKVFRE